MEDQKGTNEEVNFVPLSEASKSAGYTPEYFNWLSRKGKLKAKKIGRNWYTTTEWVRDFLHLKEAAATSENAPEIEPETGTDLEDADDLVETISAPTSEEVGVEPRQITFHWGDLGGNYSKQKNTFGKELWTVKHKEEEMVQAEIVEEEKDASEKKTEALLNYSVEVERPFNFSLAAVVAVFIVFSIFQTLKFWNATQVAQNVNAVEAANLDGQFQIQDGVVAGDMTVRNGVMLASENFGIREIQFGGGVSLLAQDYENSQLAVSDIRSEVITAKTKNTEEIKMLVYWKTNKLAVSDLEYSKMNGSSPKTSKEENYGYIHSIVISGLEPGTAYTYVITARDRWGNAVASERYSAYTGARYVSVFDLIVNSMRDVFGWAMKK